MGLKKLILGPDIHQGVREYQNLPGSALIDVRTPEEYAQGHIPGSLNVPLQSFIQLEDVVEDREAPVFVYCQSGSRSRRAAMFFEKMGYTRVKNIGGLASWTGELTQLC